MKALITGISGQDGSFLSELLLEKGYEVHGIIRRSSTPNTQNINHILNKITLHYGDLADQSSITTIISKVLPDELYNLAAQSHVRISFDIPEYTMNTTGSGILRILEALKECEILNKCRVYQAGSSEMFGKVQEVPQKETTPFWPRSPYGVAKLQAYWTIINYREAYNAHLTNGILFNHEGVRRGYNFVTRKITQSAAKIKLGLQNILFLGNLDAKRDWGDSQDFVRGMWMMLQKDTPGDYILATGETHSIREFLDEAFSHLDLDWYEYVKINPEFYRPTEVDLLIGDPSKAKRELGWEPQVTFRELVKKMVDYDMKLLGDK